ncbi:Insulin-like growth factor-binding protein complex acid labile subunit [Temnothorax longispinosus]|uniref:Insulin-like growth factor-binding protein complex acid labile subunit n=1 Tax=Temnothorax longispinosus TaxID=300112 RepID=A0A4S2JEU6_9HYME|nr:Insulin-like growth factor-binding protein complex acid labile subunit [Temnothorax longispinosus]
MNDNLALQVLPVFKTYDLEHNTFSTIRFECANCGLDSIKVGTFDEMPALTRRKLAKNRLTGLPDVDSWIIFQLDLSDYIITTLTPNMFCGAVSLSKVNLGRNPLRTLQVTSFLRIPGLLKLDVSRFLSVRGNLLRRITVEELKATPNLASLDLSHNSLDCDSEFTEAMQCIMLAY